MSKTTTKKKAPTRDELVKWLKNEMRKYPKRTAREHRVRAAKKGYTLYPLLFGLAKKGGASGKTKKKATKKKRRTRRTPSVQQNGSATIEIVGVNIPSTAVAMRAVALELQRKATRLEEAAAALDVI